ncbi:porin [bacterium]|nr:porin [bacterium]
MKKKFLSVVISLLFVAFIMPALLHGAAKEPTEAELEKELEKEMAKEEKAPVKKEEKATKKEPKKDAKKKEEPKKSDKKQTEKPAKKSEKKETPKKEAVKKESKPPVATKPQEKAVKKEVPPAPPKTPAVVKPAVVVPVAPVAPAAPAVASPKKEKTPQLYLETKQKKNLLSEASKYVDLYGKITGHMAVIGTDTFRIEDNGTRFGLALSVPVISGIKFVGKAEMALNFLQTKTSLNHDTDHDGDFILLENNSANGPIYMRLGYLGVDFGKFGILTYGKQWSVYYDFVAGWTDMFEVFGAESLGSFNAGTDGGLTGTGRADQAVQYRFAFKGLQVGMQMQTKTEYDGVRSLNPGISYTAPFGLSIGVSYNHVFMDKDLWQNIPGFSGDDGFAIAGGLKYKKTFGNHSIYVAGTFAYTENHEAVVMAIPTATNPDREVDVLFKTIGFEAFAEYSWKKMIHVYGGYNFMLARDFPAQHFNNLHISDLMMGIKAGPKPWAYAYLESRIRFGKDKMGEKPDNALTLGMTLHFSTTDMIESYMSKSD